VVGVGGGIGLRAIGWWCRPGEAILCPPHRPDVRPCRDRPGQTCQLCAAEHEARWNQLLLAAAHRQQLSAEVIIQLLTDESR